MLDYQIDYDNHPLYSSGKEVINIGQERITEIGILLVNSSTLITSHILF